MSNRESHPNRKPNKHRDDHLKKSVSILLTPNLESSQLVLVRRNPQLPFFGGYWAFPGGIVEPQDKKTPVRHLPESQTGLSPFVAAAARETFEETGIWLADPAPKVKRLQYYRDALLQGKISFAKILDQTNQTLDARKFTPLSCFVTPHFSSRRHNTWFFLAQLPPAYSLDIWHGELDSVFIATAEEALQDWYRGHLSITPPVLLFLQELRRRNCLAMLARAPKLIKPSKNGNPRRIAFSPGVLILPVKTPTLPPATHTNTYIVGEKQFYLVDPGPHKASEKQKIWELLDELFKEGCNLVGILLTHHHPDHVGALEESINRYQVPVLAHPLTLDQLPQAQLFKALQHGQQLDLGTAPDGSTDWKLNIYHVPGHTPGHLAFQETRYNGLLVGDLVSTISSTIIDPSEGRLSTYLKSLKFLASVSGGVLYPGHGIPIRDSRQHILSTIQHRLNRRRQLLSALRKHPLPVQALLEQVYVDIDPALKSLAERSLHSGLIQLQEEGRVTQESPNLWKLTPGSDLDSK